jgi:hypothetical protein
LILFIAGCSPTFAPVDWKVPAAPDFGAGDVRLDQGMPTPHPHFGLSCSRRPGFRDFQITCSPSALSRAIRGCENHGLEGQICNPVARWI